MNHCFEKKNLYLVTFKNTRLKLICGFLSMFLVFTLFLNHVTFITFLKFTFRTHEKSQTAVKALNKSSSCWKLSSN